MRSFVIVGIGRGAVRTCRRAFSSDGATGLVAGTKSGEQWGEQGVQCTVYSHRLHGLHYYIVEVLLVRSFVIASIDACR